MTNINYDYFFQLEVLHKYFADTICDDFIITPSAKTLAAINGNKMLAKQYGNRLFVGLQVDDLGKAFMTPSADLQLVFFLRLNNPLFFNYTNLASSYPAGKVYYFTNRNSNTANSKNFISAPATYNNSLTYHPGDIVADNTGTVFENIKSCKGITPTPQHKANWMAIDKNQYVSEADALQWMPAVSTYTFSSPQNSAVISVNGYDITTKKLTKNVLSKTIPLQNAKSFTLDLSSLPAGKYQLTVNGVVQLIYINDELTLQPAFAIVEIYNDSSIANANKLLNGTTLKSPVYSIDFLNRSTIWKYILHSTSKGVITTTSGFGFPTTDANSMASLTPIPLTETPLDVSLKVSVVDNVSVTPFTVSDVACPSPQRLTNVINGPDKYACSEIFLNY